MKIMKSETYKNQELSFVVEILSTGTLFLVTKSLNRRRKRGRENIIKYLQITTTNKETKEKKMKKGKKET